MKGDILQFKVHILSWLVVTLLSYWYLPQNPLDESANHFLLVIVDRMGTWRENLLQNIQLSYEHILDILQMGMDIHVDNGVGSLVLFELNDREEYGLHFGL